MVMPGDNVSIEVELINPIIRKYFEDES